MSENTKPISFWNFLNENTIEIPIIQRDYAQGRLGKENLRKNFLADLKHALDSDKTMKLDFVYGSTEKGNLNPLDGQQRLTTLWLLHWYIALRAGELNEENCKTFKKFTYETRVSSREFCQNLCIPEYFKNFEGNDIVVFITKQTWFYSAWKQDPTIQSMLRMLGGTNLTDKNGDDIVDGIEEIFQGTKVDDFKSFWEKLTQKEVIVFYHLPLKDFGLSDDLYIKMNARGKQLTSFENFKADLIGYITKQSEDESLEESEQAKWKELLDPENGIPIKLDTDWTDIFWKNKNRSIGITDKESEKRKSDQIDEIYFAFLNRFFWNELFIAKKADNSEDYILDIGKGDESSTQENNNSSYKYLNNSEHNNDVTIAYEGLDVYRYDNGTIPLLFFQKIKRVLDNYFAYSKCNSCLPECPWETSFRFIPIYEVKDDNNIEITNNANDKILSVSTLNQVQRIVFFAVCKYFDHDDEVSDSVTSLKRWMRVVWNLVSGEDQNGRPEIRSTSALRTAIKFIDSLESHKVYESLNNYDLNKLGDSSFDERCKEEIEKAKQILDENGPLRKYEGSCKKSDGSNYLTWEEIIIEAEKYAFFKGAIRFLFQNEKGEIDLDESKTWNTENFDTKLKNAKEYFDADGLSEKYHKAVAKTFVSYCNKSNQIYNKFIFSRNSKYWKEFLCSDNWSLPISKILQTSPSELDKRQLPAVNIVDDDDNDSKYTNYVFNCFDDAVFEYIIKTIPESRFHWYGSWFLGLYREGGRDWPNSIIFDWDGIHRNKYLSELSKSEVIQIDKENIIEGCTTLCRGDDIKFKFCSANKIFVWTWKNEIKSAEDEESEPVFKSDFLSEYKEEKLNEIKKKLNELQ